MPTITFRHWAMMAFLVLSWGSAIILTRVAVTDLPPLWVTSVRLVTGALTLLLYRILFVRAPWSLTRRHIPWTIWLALVSSAVPFLLISWGTQYATSATAGILIGSVPLSVLGLAHILLPDEKMTRKKVVGFVIGFIGVIIIVKPSGSVEALGQESEFLGEIAIFIASFCYALNSVTTRLVPPANNIDKSTAVVTIAAILMVAVTCVVEPFSGLGTLSLSQWGILGYLGVVSTALATLVLFVLLSQAPASFVALNNYLVPIVTALGGILFLGEHLANSVWIGFAVILFGLAISERRRSSNTTAD